MKALLIILALLASTATAADTNAVTRVLAVAADQDAARIVVWDNGRPVSTLFKTSYGYLAIDERGRASTYRKTTTGYFTVGRDGHPRSIKLSPKP